MESETITLCLIAKKMKGKREWKQTNEEEMKIFPFCGRDEIANNFFQNGENHLKTLPH